RIAAMKLYGYDKCSTCRNAKKWLDRHGIAYEDVAIVDHPPSVKLLKEILRQGDYRLSDLFNKSGMMYREMNLKDKLPSMSEADALKLLAANGKLCKRPIVTDGKKYTVGFKEDDFGK